MSSDFRDTYWPLIRNLLIAAACIGVAWWISSLPIEEGESMRELGYKATAIFFYAIAAGCILVPVGKLALGMLESVFWPSDSYTPPALYKLAEWYVEQGRYGEALAEYEKIDKNHPRQTATYMGMLEVLVYYMGNYPMGEKVLATGLKKLKKPESRQMLQQHYDNLLAQAQQAAAAAAESPAAPAEWTGELSHEEQNASLDETTGQPTGEEAPNWTPPSKDPFSR